MKKQEIITKLESDKGDTDYILRTPDEEKTFLENHKNSVIEQEMGPAVSKIHTQYDEDLYKIFGERKKPDEKTYEFMKSKFRSLKEKADKVESLERDLAELKKGSPDDSSRLKEIKDLQGKIEKMRADHETQLNELAKQNLKNTVKSDIERAMLGLKIKAGIPDSVKSVYVDSVISELSKNAEFRDGKLVFLDAEGKALRDPKTLAEYTSEALLKDRMKDIIDSGVQKPGPGINEEPPVKKTDTGFDINFVLPGTVGTKQQLTDYLVKDLGLKRTSPEYTEAYKKFSPALPMQK